MDGPLLSLVQVAQRSLNVEWRNNRILLRAQSPHTGSATLFAKGTITLLGCNSQRAVRCLVKRCIRKLCQAGFACTLASLRYSNFNVIANLGSQVLLGQLALALDERWEASYKPEVFPGCTMKLNDDTVVTIFASGSVMFNKLTSVEQLPQRFAELAAILDPYLLTA